ncbi:MAG: HAD family hydrolase [Rhodospirillales bacterium]|nr:HAD family hydrolase [Rhodospirillales bacterium]
MTETPVPRAILFDWDNTLVDSWPVIHDALNTTLVAYNHEPWTLQETRTRVRKSLRESFPDLFGDLWQEAAAVFYERYGNIHATMIEPISGIADLLSEISESGIYLGIVSNKRGDFLRKEADALAWTNYFGHIVGATDAPRDKPATDPVFMALADSGIVPGQDVWFVGDTDIDMECAIAANCLPVLMRAEPPEVDEFNDFPPHFHFDCAEALCKRLRKL